MFLRLRHFLKQGYNYCVIKNNLYSTKKAIAPNTSDGISISDNCVQKLKQLCEGNDFLRICVESGGCSGFQYKFDLDNKFADDDRFVDKYPILLII